MAVFRPGSRGEDVKKLQEALRDLDMYHGEIDGIYGPLTEGAVLEYQTTNQLTRDGIAGPQTLSSMGLSHLGTTVTSPSGSIGGGGSSGGGVPGVAPPSLLPDPSIMIPGDPTDTTDNDPTTRFTQLAGHPEIWKNSSNGKWYVVYTVPDSKPPIPMLYEVQQEDDLKIFFGEDPVKADETYTQNFIDSLGSIQFGTADSLPERGHPFQNFVQDMDRAKETMPWLEDPEVFAIYANANLQNRPVEQWELESTDWWQGHNEQQREWMWLNARDPLSADRLIDTNEIQIFNMFRNAGVREPPEGLVEFMARKFTMGQWTEAYMRDQFTEVTGGTSASGLDTRLEQWMNKTDTTVGPAKNYFTDVKDLFSTWLGPSFPPSKNQVADWAAKLRANPQAAQDELTEHLRKQRMALFPEYEDSSLTYEDIASPWRSFATGVWGQRMDETDHVFQKLIKLNDSDEGGKLLREKGLKRGVGKVEQDALSGLFGAAGGQVRGVI